MAIQATKREGIPHLWAKGNPMEMNPLDFIELVNWVDSQKKKTIGPSNAQFSEKVDGAGIRFGQDPNGNFFIESSRSGPIFNAKAFSQYAINKTGSTNPIAKGYDDIFDELSSNKSIKKILDKYNNNNGIKIIGEVLLNQFGVKHDTEEDLIRMVATWYHISKIGNFATFVLFTVQDAAGNSHPDAQKIIQELKRVSDDNLKFEDPNVNINKSVSFSKEIAAVKKTIKALETKYEKSLSEILNDPSRKRDIQTMKKDVKEELNKFQEAFSKSLAKLLSVGKFGPQFEGIVIKLANDIQFKITTDAFKDMKKELHKAKTLKEDHNISSRFKSLYYLP